MKLVALFLLAAGGAAIAFDSSPIGTFTFNGQTLADAKVTAVSGGAVTVTGKNGARVLVPLSAAEKLPQLKSRVKDEIAKANSADPANPETEKVFKVYAVYPDGLHCAVCRVDYKAPRSPGPANGQQLTGVNYNTLNAAEPQKIMKESSEQAFVVGYKHPVADGEFITVKATKGDVKNLGPERGNATLRVWTVKN